MSEKLPDMPRWFTWGTRADGSRYCKLTDGAPDVVRDLIYQAHDAGEILPDDRIYADCYEVLCELYRVVVEQGDITDLASDSVWHEIADGLVPVYNSDRLDWLRYYPCAADWVDYVREEWDTDGDLLNMIGVGIYARLRGLCELWGTGLLESVPEWAPNLDGVHA
jgi:hypothetical protein